MSSMINRYTVDYYRIALLSLKQKRVKGKANLAKPVMLLAIIDGIEAQTIRGNQIRIDDIKSRYEELLPLYQEEKTPLRYPFYYLQTDGIWHINWSKPIPDKMPAPSEKYLRENVTYASLENALWDVLQEKEIRVFYKQTILDYYMSTTDK